MKEVPSGRLLSLDALRGLDMMFITGLGGVVVSICALFPGGAESWLATQFDHVEWNGFHFEDLIFPLFLFISGVSFPYSYANQLRKGMNRKAIYLKIFRRGILLVLLGLVYNGFLKLDFAHLRFGSVLARIGLAWMFAAIIYINTGKTARILISVAILLGYALLLCLCTAPDAPAGAGPLSFEGNIVGYVDRCLWPDHLYRHGGGIFDPEGLLSTVPAIVTALLGMMTGDLTRLETMDGKKKTLTMALSAVLLLAAGYLLSLYLPICKKLWSSSFVLVAGGYSVAAFALFYWIIDVLGYRRWTLPFRVVGMNSITIYMLSAILSFECIIDYFLGGLIGLLPDVWREVVWSTAWLACMWLVAYCLYKCKIFIKI